MAAPNEVDWDQILFNAVGVVDELLAAEKKITWTALAEPLGLHRSSVKQGFEREFGILKKDLPDLRNHLHVQQMVEAHNAAVVFHDKKQREDVDWREFLDLAETNRELNGRIDDTQKIAEITIETDRPFCLMHTGDWHLGDQYTDHTEWGKDIEFVLETPNLGMIDLGDDRQNMRVFRVLSAVLGQVLSPTQQALMLRSVVKELTRESKLIAKVGGNHDEEFDQSIFGESLQSYLLENMKAPRFRNRGLLKLTVGSELYTVLIFHKSRFKSFLRRAHGAMREHQLSYPADIIAGGHDHSPGMENYWHYNLAREAGMGFGGEVILIKTGTYQDSDYGWKYYHDGGFPINYTVVLFPDRHKKVVFSNPRDAVRYANSF